MAHDLPDAFVRHFGADVHLAYQRQGSLLRNTVRTRSGIVGNSTTFQRLGQGQASTKVRHGRVTPMNPDHSNVECFLQDWYAGDWVDILDLTKIAHDERMILANTGAYALGRRTDEMIIAQLNLAEVGTAINRSVLDLQAMTDWVAALGARDVPMNLGMVYGAVSWPVWSRLMTFPQFAASDYVGDDLPYKTPFGQTKVWAGCIWMPHTGLTGGAAARECHVYHKTAVGHAIGTEATSDITWNGPEASWFVNNMMSQGAILIDAAGVVTRTINETA